MRVPDEVLKCVVFVGLLPVPSNDQKPFHFIGTAFFISMPSGKEGTRFVYLITAKHVAEKLAHKQFLLRMNNKRGSSDFAIGDGAEWFTHPSDDSVDVAVLPYAPSLDEFDYKTIGVETFLTDDVIRVKNIGVGDEVFITGLFAHVCGFRRNLPIMRIGNIAMMPDEAIPTKDFGNIDACLVEARSIGGLSGSPVFVRETVPVGIGSFYLLGLMHGHWEISANRKNDLLGDELGSVNMGIAIVIPAKKIMEVLNHPDLIEKRRKANERLLG